MKALALSCLVLVVGAVVSSAAPISGAWSFWVRADTDPFSVADMESVLEVDYSLSGWTYSSTAVADLDGLDNLYFDVAGVLGGFALRSILDFDAEEAQFRTWLASGVTAIGGVNLYATFMVDNVGTAQAPSIGTGLTLGGWKYGDVCSVWFQTRFNMNDSSTNLYKYGYDWLLDHFIFRVCDSWQKPSGYLDVQTSGCTLAWSGADVFVETPFSCFTLLTELSVSCGSGFDSVLFELSDMDLGLDWLELEWVDVFFTIDTKSVNVVLDLSFAEAVCVTPYMVLEGGGSEITGIALKALKLAYTWNGVTFKAGELFDEDGWSEYLNGDFYEWGWSWDGELTYLSSCKAPANYDEYFGLLIDGDSCCGGSFEASVFSWFDTGSSTAAIFDWVETRASVWLGVGYNTELSFSMSLTDSGVDWIQIGGRFIW